MSSLQTTDRVGKLRYVIGWREPSRARRLAQIWVIIVTEFFFLVLYIVGPGQQLRQVLFTLGFIAVQPMVMCMVVGELLYARVRILAGLFSVAYLFVFAHLSIVLFAAQFYLRGMTFGLLIALLLSIFLLGSYGHILQHYRYTRNGDAQQG